MRLDGKRGWTENVSRGFWGEKCNVQLVLFDFFKMQHDMFEMVSKVSIHSGRHTDECVYC